MQIFVLIPQSPTRALLEADEARHCLKVLRHRTGDILDAIDGAGAYYRVRILGSSRNEVELEILERIENWGEHPYRINLLASPLRLRDRNEWLLEKAVELGVTDIFPIQSQHTVAHAGYKQERAHKIMLSALKQCKRSRLPVLHELQSFTQHINRQAAGLRLIAQADHAVPLGTLSHEIDAHADISLWIGPEGDFSPEELSTAIAAGFKPVHLGKQRLRTETAAIHGISLIKGVDKY